EKSGEMAKTTFVYGDRDTQAKGEQLAKDAGALPAPAAAERAAFNGKQNRTAAYDLLDCLKQNKVKLEEIKKEHLPAEMQKMTLDEQKAHIKKLEEKRGELQKEAVELDKKRADFIAKKQAEDKTKSAFDTQVLEILRKQAKKAKIDY